MQTRLSLGTKTRTVNMEQLLMCKQTADYAHSLCDYASNIFALTPTVKHNSVSFKHNQIGILTGFQSTKKRANSFEQY